MKWHVVVGVTVPLARLREQHCSRIGQGRCERLSFVVLNTEFSGKIEGFSTKCKDEVVCINDVCSATASRSDLGILERILHKAIFSLLRLRISVAPKIAILMMKKRKANYWLTTIK